MIETRSELEATIVADPRWQEGASWGKPRPGHPEGSIESHIVAVLANIDAMYCSKTERADLRLIALIHDTFKYQVDVTKSRHGTNHHGYKAREFAEKYFSGRSDLLQIIQLHDEAYNSFQVGNRDNKWDKAKQRAINLIADLGRNLDLYLAFYEADNTLEGKDGTSFEWFMEFSEQIVSHRDYPALVEQARAEKAV